MPKIFVQSAAVQRRLDPFAAALPAGAALPAAVPWGPVAAAAAAINAASVAALALGQHLTGSPAGILGEARLMLAGGPRALESLWARLQRHSTEKLSAADRTIMLVAVGSLIVCVLDPSSALLGQVRGKAVSTAQTPFQSGAQRRNFWCWVFLLVSGATTAELAGLAWGQRRLRHWCWRH